MVDQLYALYMGDAVSPGAETDAMAARTRRGAATLPVKQRLLANFLGRSVAAANTMPRAYHVIEDALSRACAIDVELLSHSVI